MQVATQQIANETEEKSNKIERKQNFYPKRE